MVAINSNISIKANTGYLLGANLKPWNSKDNDNLTAITQENKAYTK